MSKLPKAPLIEVVFELRWMIEPQEGQTIQYLPGDLYPLVKEKYPFREAIQGVPLFVGTPTSRFRTAQNDYPLIQIGPGVFTVNTTDAKYFWKEYERDIVEAIQNLNKIYTFKDTHNVTLTLRYIDLLKFDFGKDDLLKFLEEKLHITVKQEFYKTNTVAKNIVLSMNYGNELGALDITISQGKNMAGEDGIVIQTNIISNVIKPEAEKIRVWLDKAHELTSNLFKEMTKGHLQKQFASKG